MIYVKIRVALQLGGSPAPGGYRSIGHGRGPSRIRNRNIFKLFSARLFVGTPPATFPLFSAGCAQRRAHCQRPEAPSLSKATTLIPRRTRRGFVLIESDGAVPTTNAPRLRCLRKRRRPLRKRQPRAYDEHAEAPSSLKATAPTPLRTRRGSVLFETDGAPPTTYAASLNPRQKPLLETT